MLLLAVIALFLLVTNVCSAPLALRCCEEPSRVACLQRHHSSRQLHANTLSSHDYAAVTLISYDTTEILDYALYAFAINSAFADYHSYDIFTTSSMGGFEYEKRDQRWNKVKIVHSIIVELVNRNITDRYIVWMDSDLIVLNFDLDIIGLTAMHPKADIIVSQDVEPLNGMINTGCMIVRSTNWALQFFDEWWNNTDRVDGMDQHVFDSVYNRRLAQLESGGGPNSAGDVRTKIAILPPHVLNSQIPARVHQQVDHKVLHLAGESCIVRTHIFQLAFAELCKATQRVSTSHTYSTATSTDDSHNEHNSDVPHIEVTFRLNTSALTPQLGITREALRNVDYRSLIIQEVRGILSSMSRCGDMHVDGGDGSRDIDYSAETSICCDIGSIIKLRSKLRDAMQSRDLARSSPTDSSSDASNSDTTPGDTLTQLHIQGLLWALYAHQAAYRQLLLQQDTTVVRVHHKDLHQTHASMTMEQLNIQNGNFIPQPAPAVPVRVPVVTKQDELDHLQAIVDAAFEVCVRNGVSPDILHDTLITVAPVISTILTDFVSPASLGPALYYKFKYFDLQSGYYKVTSRHEKEYESLTFAHDTWIQMSQLHFYGTGNTVADPYKEIAVILTRMAEHECSAERGDINMRQIGLKHVLQSVNYTATAWLPRSTYRQLLQLTNSVDAHGAAQSNDALLSVLRGIFSDPLMVGVSSKVLHILARGYITAYKCASSSTSSTISAPTNGAAEPEISSTEARYARVAAHICALLRQRGEECVPEVLTELSVHNIDALLLSAAGDQATEGVAAHGTPQRQGSDGSAADNKQRVRLKRKKVPTM